MPAGEFKARCLKVMDDVHSTREPVVITKKGKPVAKLVPADGQPGDIFGCLRDEVEIVGDIVSPAVPPEDCDDYPKDPVDRLVGATARAEGIPLVTRDERIRGSPLLKTIW